MVYLVSHKSVWPQHLSVALICARERRENRREVRMIFVNCFLFFYTALLRHLKMTIQCHRLCFVLSLFVCVWVCGSINVCITVYERHFIPLFYVLYAADVASLASVDKILSVGQQ